MQLEMNVSSSIDRATGALLGLAVGDALGTTVEFKRRDTYPRLTDMIGGGPFNMEAGEWTDDTSMALCLAESLIANKGELNPQDLLSRFLRWWKDGENSTKGYCFDIGNATRRALEAFSKTGSTVNNTEPDYQANGSIMRLAPAVICAPTAEDAIRLAKDQGRTTHAADIPMVICGSMAEMLWQIAETGLKSESLTRASALNATRDHLVSSGHVTATYEAACWCVDHTSTFRDAVLTAANLGDDADTVGAVTGQIAGALYGYSGIPQEWIAKLAWHDRIIGLARELWQFRGRGVDP